MIVSAAGTMVEFHSGSKVATSTTAGSDRMTDDFLFPEGDGGGWPSDPRQVFGGAGRQGSSTV
jgi:hypothetical protein